MNEVKQTKPTDIPFKCPVCNGFGTLKYGELKCNSCDGKGFVVVRQTDRQKGDED